MRMTTYKRKGSRGFAIFALITPVPLHELEEVAESEECNSRYNRHSTIKVTFK